MRFLIAMRANTASWKQWRPWACSKLSGSIRSPDPSSVASPQRGRLSLKSVDGSTDNMNRHDRRRFATKKHASVAGLREFTRTADELEALGLLELSRSIRSPDQSGVKSQPKGGNCLTLTPRQSTDRSTEQQEKSHDQQQRFCLSRICLRIC